MNAKMNKLAIVSQFHAIVVLIEARRPDRNQSARVNDNAWNPNGEPAFAYTLPDRAIFNGGRQAVIHGPIRIILCACTECSDPNLA